MIQTLHFTGELITLPFKVRFPPPFCANVTADQPLVARAIGSLPLLPTRCTMVPLSSKLTVYPVPNIEKTLSCVQKSVDSTTSGVLRFSPICKRSPQAFRLSETVVAASLFLFTFFQHVVSPLGCCDNRIPLSIRLRNSVTL